MLADFPKSSKVIFKMTSRTTPLLSDKKADRRSACSYSKATSQNNSFYPNSKKQQSHVLYFQNFLLNLFEQVPSSTSSRANSALISLNNFPKPICLFRCKPFVKSSVILSLTISENNVTSSVSTSKGLTGYLAVSIMADFRFFRLCALTVEYLRQAYNSISSP